MKSFLKISGIIIILILALAFILPLAFKGKIIELAKTEINKNVNATVDFTDMDLSLLSSFPDFVFTIEELSVTGKDTFDGDTLVYMKNFNITLDLMSVFSGDNYEVKKIVLVDPVVNVMILDDGKANYDIALTDNESQDGQEAEEESDQSFVLKLKKFKIYNGKIVYNDKQLGIKLSVSGLEHSLSGDLSADKTIINTLTKISGLTLEYEGINYLKNVAVNYRAGIDADLKNEIYTLKKNELKLNNLAVDFNGSVSMLDNDDINIVMSFSTPVTNFKSILSLIPAIYSKDFETIQTAGTFSLNGNIKGVYNEDDLPGFVVNLAVDDAMFKYPDLPEAVTDINVNTKISNKGGDADNTVIDISKFHLNLAGNTFDVSLLLKTPVSDPDIKAKLKGEMDLSSIGNFYPLDENEALKGTFLADITMNGKLSDIENEKYENFTALGSMLVKGFTYHTSSLSAPLQINHAQVNFSPQYIDLVSFVSNIAKSDFRAKGKLENYLQWFLKNGYLKGSLSVNSSYLDITSLTPETQEETQNSTSTQSTQEEQTQTAAGESQVIEIPENIEFVLNTRFDTLIYDNITLSGAKAELAVKNQKIEINNLSAGLFDGTIGLNGFYSTQNINKPEIDFNIEIKDIKTQNAYEAFTIVKKYVPIMEKTEGEISAGFKMAGYLDNTMSLDFNTLNGGGNLKTTPLKIKSVNTLEKIAEALKLDKLKTLDLKGVSISFEFIDGKIMVKPFTIAQGNIKGEVSGWTGFDSSIEYLLALQIPRKEFGNAANEALEKLIGQANSLGANFSLGENVPVNILIGGTLNNPTVKPSFGKGGSVKDDIKSQLEDELKKKKEELSKEAAEKAGKIIADAEKQAQKIISEAEKQVAIIKSEADKGAQRVKEEAAKQAEKLIAEGKKNGPIAEIAAKKAADKVKKEAAKNADKIVNEADKKANAILQKAKQQAAAIRKKAKQEADQVLKNN